MQECWAPDPGARPSFRCGPAGGPVQAWARAAAPRAGLGTDSCAAAHLWLRSWPPAANRAPLPRSFRPPACLPAARWCPACATWRWRCGGSSKGRGRPRRPRGSGGRGRRSGPLRRAAAQRGQAAAARGFRVPAAAEAAEPLRRMMLSFEVGAKRCSRGDGDLHGATAGAGAQPDLARAAPPRALAPAQGQHDRSHVVFSLLALLFTSLLRLERCTCVRLTATSPSAPPHAYMPGSAMLFFLFALQAAQLGPCAPRGSVQSMPPLLEAGHARRRRQPAPRRPLRRRCHWRRRLLHRWQLRCCCPCHRRHIAFAVAALYYPA